MDIKWLQAVIDIPASEFEQAADFWTSVTGSTKGDVHPDHDEYLHLVPPSGDMHLELQRIDDGSPRVHLDLLVEDIAAATEEAIAAGATLVVRPGHAVLTTPGGVPFCIVPFSGESQKAPAIDPARPHAVDNICIDIPHEHFDADVAFWAQLTGWEISPVELPEYRSFEQPTNFPLRILLQQLGADDTGPPRAHLDISAGEHRLDLVAEHVAQGAAIRDSQDHWTALIAPGGHVYCLTDAPPLVVT